MSDEMSDDLDFSSFDTIDELDWSDVEEELKQNKDMIMSEASQPPPSSGAAAAQAQGAGNSDISSLIDIPLNLTVEVGRKKMLIKDLLAIDTESVLELEKGVGEPLNVMVNDKIVAKGEVVVHNARFGLKITKIIDQNEILNNIL